MNKPDFSQYPNYEELQAILERMVGEKSHLTKMYSIGKTHEKRDIWVLEITNAETGPANSKPAMYIDGNIHAGEVTGSVVCVYTAWYLLSQYGKNPFVTDLVDKKAFYIIPRISADGAEMFLRTPHSLRSSTREYPHRDKLKGLVAKDVDGDGLILQMRLKHPDGEWKVSLKDSRIMLKREPWDVEGPFYRVYTEGIMENWDGKDVKQAPSKWGLDINRNFPANWVPESTQKGAGPYPLSEPETRAMADFIVGHPNIGAAMAYHTTMGAILRPSCTKSDKDLPSLDVEIYKTIGQKGTQLTGYPHISTFEEYTSDKNRPLRGVFMDWLYEHLGIITFSTELWDASVRAGNPVISRDRMSEDSQLNLLKWNDRELSGLGFVDWHDFDHPQLGPVEIGGWKSKFVLVNPPSQYLEAECHKNCLFTLYHAACLPQLAVEPPMVEEVSPGIYKVFARIKNEGFKPTNICQKAIEVGRADPVKAILSGPSLEFVLGKPEEEIGHLEGLSAAASAYPAQTVQVIREKSVEWVVKAEKGTCVTVAAASRRAGKTETTLTLE